MNRIKQQTQCLFLFSPDDIDNATLHLDCTICTCSLLYSVYWSMKYYFNIYLHNIFIDLYFYGHNSIQSISNIFAKNMVENLYY